jgi:hypothetical protein
VSTQHISDDLPRLLTGDATRDEVMTAAEHLRSCPDCQQELVSAVISHAALTSAHRFAPDLVSRSSGDEEAAAARHEAEPDPLPDLSGIFAQVRDEATETEHRPARNRHRLLAVAAAAVVLAGGGATIAETVGSSSSDSSRSVALTAYGVGKDNASVTIVGDKKLRVDASALPKLTAQHHYEVWLTNAARNRMQAVGAIGVDNVATLPVKANDLKQFSDIEVSVQKDHQTVYSGTSVLRGALN